MLWEETGLIPDLKGLCHGDFAEFWPNYSEISG